MQRAGEEAGDSDGQLSVGPRQGPGLARLMLRVTKLIAWLLWVSVAL